MGILCTRVDAWMKEQREDPAAMENSADPPFTHSQIFMM